MSLVHAALAQPRERREIYLREACDEDLALFEEAWTAVAWEERMAGFLAEPVVERKNTDVAFTPGEVLEGRFQILREVARGGMGIVYEARDRKLDRRIALKIAKTEHRRTLAREVRNASEVSHPNVCKLYEIHTASTSSGPIDFITMEFLDGETLSARLKRGPLPKPEALTIARQICAGVAEAHRNQVIHGDLKSGNVILVQAPAEVPMRAVITDFGLAYRPDAAPGTIFEGQAGGTPAYMAPELRNGEKATVASDIYAMGVLLCEVFGGRRPDQMEGRASQSTATVDGSPTGLRPTLEPKFDRVIARCIDPDPAARYGSAEEVLKALGPSQTRRNVLIGAAAALAAVVTGVVTYQQATAPKSVVRLSFEKLQAAPGTEQAAASLNAGLEQQLAKLKSSSTTRFSVRGNPTHTFRGTLTPGKDRIAVHAYLSDTRTKADIKEWQGVYRAEEMKYAPVALAGVVTNAFTLDPPGAGVNEAARADYATGLKNLRGLSRTNAALAALDRAVVADPDSALIRAALAEAQWFKYFATRDKAWLERAEESARQAELRNPDLAPVHRIVGLLQARPGRYEEAEAHYRRAIQLDPRNGDAYRRLGSAYVNSNRMPEALVALQRAVEADPTDFRNYQDLGWYFDLQSKYEDAVVQYRKAVELAPDEAEARRGLARAYQSLGRLSEAEAELRAALRLAETPALLHSLGVALMYQGRDSEAIPYIRRAVQIGPENLFWLLNLGVAQIRSGEISGARTSCARALELAEAELQGNPRDAYTRSALAYLTALRRDERRAESEIAQALQLAPKDSDVRFFGALTFEALGRRDATISLLTSSPTEVLSDLGRWPAVADLRRDPRFIQLLASRAKEKGEQ